MSSKGGLNKAPEHDGILMSWDIVVSICTEVSTRAILVLCQIYFRNNASSFETKLWTCGSETIRQNVALNIPSCAHSSVPCTIPMVMHNRGPTRHGAKIN